jgi:hypothetical protein
MSGAHTLEWFLRRDALRRASEPRAALTQTQREAVEYARATVALLDALLDGDFGARALVAADKIDALARTLAYAAITRLRASLDDDHTLKPRLADANEAPHIARALLRDVVDTLDPMQDLVPKLRRERLWRVSLAGLSLVAVVWLAPIAMLRARPDRATHATWTASSAEGDFARTGRGFVPSQSNTEVFFHTQMERAPWIELDLGTTHTIRSVTLHNRMDCCQERAAPLSLSCSTDRSTWNLLATREDPFFVWNTLVAAQPCRYLRVQAHRETALHLARVEVR